MVGKNFGKGSSVPAKRTVAYRLKAVVKGSREAFRGRTLTAEIEKLGGGGKAQTLANEFPARETDWKTSLSHYCLLCVGRCGGEEKPDTTTVRIVMKVRQEIARGLGPLKRFLRTRRFEASPIRNENKFMGRACISVGTDSIGAKTCIRGASNSSGLDRAIFTHCESPKSTACGLLQMGRHSGLEDGMDTYTGRHEGGGACSDRSEGGLDKTGGAVQSGWDWKRGKQF